MTYPITGSCLCNQVRYEVTGSPLFTNLCHCENCRKVTGSCFMANSCYLSSQLLILTGEESLKVYKDSQTTTGGTLHRTFCLNCGSPLFVRVDGMDTVVVTSGTMNLGPSKDEWHPQLEFWCKSRKEWLPSLDFTEKQHTSPGQMDDVFPQSQSAK